MRSKKFEGYHLDIGDILLVKEVAFFDIVPNAARSACAQIDDVIFVIDKQKVTWHDNPEMIMGYRMYFMHHLHGVIRDYASNDEGDTAYWHSRFVKLGCIND